MMKILFHLFKVHEYWYLKYSNANHRKVGLKKTTAIFDQFHSGFELKRQSKIPSGYLLS